MTRRDPNPPSGGGEDPLDAALGGLDDLADLQARFAALDAELEAKAAGRAEDDDDPFADIARALREHRESVGRSDASDDEGHDGVEDEDESSHEAEDEDSDDPLDSEIDERCQEALDALEEDDLPRARELAMEAVRLDDEHPFPMFVLGLVAEREGDLDTARDMAELSLRTAATNADAIGLRAHIHVRQHEFAEAEELLRYGIAHNPDEATLHEGLARVALARGDHEAALRAATAALRLEPDNHGALAVRSAALEAGADRGALLAALRQGVQLHPEDPYAMVELASVEMEYGNLERARVLLMRAQRLAPRDSEIGDVRSLVEYVYERPLLRPVPGLLRWMRDFPGGMAGFLVGYVIAALPLHALAVSMPEYRAAAITVIAAWGLVALYAWVAPSVLTHRLNQRAARDGARRVVADLEDPLAPAPSVDRLTDVLSMLVVANLRRRALALARLVASRAEPTAAAALDEPVRHLRGIRMRTWSALRLVPGLPRMLVAVAVLLALASPSLASADVLPALAWHGLALACVAAAWLLVRAERAMVATTEVVLTEAQVAAGTTRDAA